MFSSIIFKLHFKFNYIQNMSTVKVKEESTHYMQGHEVQCTFLRDITDHFLS